MTRNALHYFGSGNWLVSANNTAAHYAAIQCSRQRTIKLTVCSEQLADIPPPQSATLSQTECYWLNNMISRPLRHLFLWAVDKADAMCRRRRTHSPVTNDPCSLSFILHSHRTPRMIQAGREVDAVNQFTCRTVLSQLTLRRVADQQVLVPRHRQTTRLTAGWPISTPCNWITKRSTICLINQSVI